MSDEKGGESRGKGEGNEKGKREKEVWGKIYEITVGFGFKAGSAYRSRPRRYTFRKPVHIQLRFCVIAVDPAGGVNSHQSTAGTLTFGFPLRYM